MSFGQDAKNPFSNEPDPNPYSPPSGGGAAAGGGGSRAFAAGKLKGPAIALLIVAPLGIIILLLDIGGRMIGIAGGANPAFADAPAGFNQGFAAGNYIGLVVDVIAIVCQIVIIVGALNMLKVRKRSMAVTACVLSVIPCLSSCCIVGIPFGVWGLIALNDPAVKAAFPD